MKKFFRMTMAVIAMVITMIAVCSFSSSAADVRTKWISAWGTAPTQIGIDGYGNIAAYVGDVTARTVITPTASGTKMRIKLSNFYGEEPITIYNMTVAKSLGDSKVDSKTYSVLFDGSPSVTIPAGKEFYSDPIDYPVRAQEDIAISIYIKDYQDIKTMGLSGGQSYLTMGDATRAADFNLLSGFVDNEQVVRLLGKFLNTNFELGLEYSFIKVVPCLATIDVLSNESAYSVVVVGDSTVSNEFPLYLSQSIYENEGLSNVGIVGKGIIGNRLLGDGLGYGSLLFGDALLDRFQRDVIAQSGVEYVIVKIGANDIIHPVCSDIVQEYPGIEQPTAQDIINGYKKIFDACHDVGIKVIATSITQWKGSTRNYFGTGDKYVRTQEEFNSDWQIALDVNDWLSKTTAHDGFVDLAGYSANPLDYASFLPEDTIDGIHPSDLLQQKWAEYFPLGAIGVGKNPAGVTLHKSSFLLYKGKSYTIKATVYPETAENKEVIWHSENPDVVKVDKNGKVTALKNGTATIVCETKYGSGEPIYTENGVYTGYIAKCVITVKTLPEKITLDKTTAEVYATKSIKLKATVSPSTTSDKSVTWKSSNTKVAVVDANGKVTGVGSGTATITATSTTKNPVSASCKVTVLKKKEVTGLSLSSDGGSMYKGKTHTLVATIYPSNATFKDVKWTSSNSKVVSVDANGKLTALKAGTAVIKCTSVDNPMVFATCNVTVKVKVTGVKLNRTSGSLYETKSGALTATVSPSDATDKRVKWTSSNTKIATVDSKGNITGIKPGTVYITATTVNGGYTATCKVTIKAIVKSTGVKLNKTALTISHGHTYDLVATVSPSNATNKSLTWKSSDTKIVKVSSKGVITAVKPGTATVTCTTKDTGKKATCKVTVKAVVPTSVYFPKESGSINYNKDYKLTATVLPTNATNKSLKWSSSDPSVVSVTSDGVIRGHKPGKSAVITVTTVSGNKSDTIKVKVNPIKVKSVKLNKEAAVLSKGQTMTLKATVSPSNATNKGVTWQSSDKSVVTVSSSGTVKAVGNGKAIVTCLTKDGGFVAVCIIEVKTIKVMGITLDQPKLTLSKGKTYTLKATIVPSNASNKKVVWTSSDPSVAKVDANGKVTAVGKGICQVKVKTVDGNWIASCKVTVV